MSVPIIQNIKEYSCRYNVLCAMQVQLTQETTHSSFNCMYMSKYMYGTKQQVNV